MKDSKLMTVNCLVCGKERTVYFSQYKTGRGRYCSKSCLAKSKTGEKHPRWNPNGLTKKVNGKYIPIYRIIAEKALGRPLKQGEVVHHIDGNRLNNVNSNLLICTDSYHRRLHYLMNPEVYKKGLEKGTGWQRRKVQRVDVSVSSRAA